MPLLRELILEAVQVDELHTRDRYQYALRDLLVSQVRKASQVPIFITLPRDRRALAVAQAALQAVPRPLTSPCVETAVGVRTVERLFRKEVGTSFEAWRRQAKLTKAVELLVTGYSVKEAAYNISYSQPSTFVQDVSRDARNNT